jgi:tetratricopeptide (TPR) repeat protein/transcriptional regulator with XRE-family HTH domain
MAMPPKPGSKAYRNRERERLARLGVEGRQLTQQLVDNLMRCGCRPREAWRLACELTQEEVAARFNQIRNDPYIRMRGSRICEYEKWPVGGTRPSVRALKILAAVYETTWDRLVDVDDLERMPASDRQVFLDISDLRYGDLLNLPAPRERPSRPASPHGGDDPEVNQQVTAKELAPVRERLTVPSPETSSERSGSGVSDEVTHLTGRENGQAREHYTQALVDARQLGDRRAEANALRGLGQVEWFVGEYGQAREYHTEALALARRLGERRAEADALRGLGQVERLVGEYGQAREHYTQALALARQLSDRAGEVESLWGLGQVERLVGEYGRAREHYTQALALARRLGERRAEADALRGLGQVERLVGEYGQAREYHTQALALARRLGERRAEADALRRLGEVEWLVGEYGQAREYHTQALALARRLGDRRAEAEALWGLGHVATDTAERDQACELWGRALEIYDELGIPFAETVHAAMSQLEC